jgi:AbrB family looped-hinge helix DNA binding protein
MITRVSTKGQIILPLQLRQKDGIVTGQKFEIERVESGEYILRRVSSPVPNAGVVKWLLNCPEKNWLEIPSDSESTADLSIPEFE